MILVDYSLNRQQLYDNYNDIDSVCFFVDGYSLNGLSYDPVGNDKTITQREVIDQLNRIRNYGLNVLPPNNSVFTDICTAFNMELGICKRMIEGETPRQWRSTEKHLSLKYLKEFEEYTKNNNRKLCQQLHDLYVGMSSHKNITEDFFYDFIVILSEQNLDVSHTVVYYALRYLVFDMGIIDQIKQIQQQTKYDLFVAEFLGLGTILHQFREVGSELSEFVIELVFYCNEFFNEKLKHHNIKYI